MAQQLVTLEVQLSYTAQSFDHERPQVTIRAVLTTEASAGSILGKRTGGGARTSHPYHADAPVFWTDAPRCSPLDGGPPGE